MDNCTHMGAMYFVYVYFMLRSETSYGVGSDVVHLYRIGQCESLLKWDEQQVSSPRFFMSLIITQLNYLLGVGRYKNVIMNEKETTYDIDEVVITNSSASFCRYCGSKILPNSAFCSVCGKPLRNIEGPVAPANTTPMQLHSTKPTVQLVYASQQPQQANQTTVIVNERKSNGIGTAGFVFALLSILLSWVPVVDFLIWFLGLLFSFIGLFKAPRDLAITGFILSIIGIIIIIAIFGSIAAVLSNM